MSEEDIEILKKEVKKCKRIANEWAAMMHDLVEERLPAAFEEIQPLAQSTYDACKAWKDASDKLNASQASK